MSLKKLLLKVLRVEWLSEVDTTADILLKAFLQKTLPWRWRLAGVGGIAFLFLVPFSIFALTPQEQNVLREHQALEDSSLVLHQAHEQRDAVNNHYSKAILRRMQKHQQQERQTLLVHQAQERSLPNGSFTLTSPQLAQQQQKELHRLLLQQQHELRKARRAHRSKRFIQLLRRRQHMQLLALQQHFRDEDQASPFAMRDLDDFDSPNFDFFPHPRRGHLDSDGDYDND